MKSLQQAQNILILGMGREGISTLKYLNTLNDFSGKISLYDQKPASELNLNAELTRDTTQILGQPLSILSFADYDLIIKSPGIPNRLLPKNLGTRLTSPTAIFLSLCPCPIIGVTGTKGKSTTASLIYSILHADNRESFLLGNIGRPALDSLSLITPKSSVVMELSSHQLSRLTISPHIAVILGIFPEHLDYYPNFQSYLDAKSNITKYQTNSDIVVYDPNNTHAQIIANLSPGKHFPITKLDMDLVAGFRSKLPGNHYKINLALATKTADILGVNHHTIKQALLAFEPLPHRLEIVGTFNNITFYNDSLATVPTATIAALDELGDKVDTLILGDHDRHLEYLDLAKRILASNISNLILFPPVGEQIWETILKLKSSAHNRFNQVVVTKMREAITFAYKYTRHGKICLLSPAASSFANFKDYEDRGNQFKYFVRTLGQA